MAQTKDDHAQTAQRCYLLELPPELRLHIFELVYDYRFQCTIFIYNDMTYQYNHNLKKITGLPPHLTALPRTSRLLRHEATPLLYTTATFKLFIMDMQTAPIWQDARTAESKAHGVLKHLVKLSKLNIWVKDRERDGPKDEKYEEWFGSLWGALCPGECVKVDEIGLFVHREPAEHFIDKILEAFKCEVGAKMSISTYHEVRGDVLEKVKGRLGLVEVVQKRLSVPDRKEVAREETIRR